MRRTPGFAIGAALTLALGIGLNTAVFSAVHRVLIAQLPYGDANRLTRIYGRHLDEPDGRGQLSAADVIDFRARQRSFTDIATFAYGSLVFAAQDAPQRLVVPRVTVNIFDVFGVPAALGRTFREGDDAIGEIAPIVLSHAAWQRLFGGDPAVVGRKVLIGNYSREVLGVMPASFEWPEGEADGWMPLNLSAQAAADPVRARRMHNLGAYGRVRAGSTVAQARDELVQIARDLAVEHPTENSDMTVQVLSLRDAMVGRARPALLVLAAAATLVLLIACANVAGLLLSRTVARRQELAIRASLGAGGGRLARQLLAESLLLSAIGGSVGVALAYGAAAFLARIPETVAPGVDATRIDTTVLLFALGLTVACGLLFGSAPALVAARRDLGDPLRSSSRTTSGGLERQRLRHALVVGQMALALALLVGAGLLTRSLVNLQRVPLGFATERVLTFQVGLSGAHYDTSEKEDQFWTALLGRLRAIPGVVAAGAGGSLPLAGISSASVAIEGRPVPAGAPPEVKYSPASAGYFEALGIPLVRGRSIEDRDRADAPDVVVINEAMAKLHWPGADPIGARVRLGPDPSEPWATVIGVVGDVRQKGVAAEPEPAAYVSQLQDHWGFGRVLVRASGEPVALLSAVRSALREVDPSIPLDQPRTMEEIIDGDLAGRRVPMQLLTAFATLALLLAAVGVYGVMAYAVASRTREFGTRMALGARPRAIFDLVMRQALTTSAVGLLLGLVAAVAGVRMLGSLLYGVQPFDLATFAIAGVLLALVVVAACLLPARRATRVDPMVALRSE
jgi:predicted permease